MLQSQSERLFQADRGAIVCRTPMFPVERLHKLYESSGTQAIIDAVTQEPAFTAILIASPSLANEVQRWGRGTEIERNALLRATAYFARMCARSTPFGMFSSIGTLHWIEHQAPRLAPLESAVTRSRVSMTWLKQHVMCDFRFESKPAVRTSDHLLILDDKILVPDFRSGRTDDSALVTLTKTPWLLSFFAFCDETRSFEAATTHLLEVLDTDRISAEDIVLTLMQRGALLTEFDSSYVLDRSRALDRLVQTYTSSEIQSLWHDAQRAAERFDDGPIVSSPVTSRQDGSRATSFLNDRALIVDTYRNISGSLPEQVLKDIDLLASILFRNSYTLRLNDYQRRFLVRYEGAERRVPLLELVDSDMGLGPPEAFTLKRPESPQRTAFLANRLAEALRGRDSEIVLADNDMAQLLAEPAPAHEMPRSFEVGVRILASSWEALTDGTYLVAPGNFISSNRAGAASGRFCKTLDLAFRDESRPEEHYIEAELLYRPKNSKLEDLADRVIFHDTVLAIGLFDVPGKKIIRPSDLSVGIEDGVFKLYLHDTGVEVRAIESHMVQNWNDAPPLVRLITMLMSDGQRFAVPFGWGPIGSLPYLPRVRYGRCILSPARWTVEAEYVASDARAAVAKLRDRYDMPRWVALTKNDNSLAIDTTSSLALDVLADQASKSDEQWLTLKEPFLSNHDLLVQDSSSARYVSEFIIPFERGQELPARTRSPRPTLATRTAKEWLYYKCYVGRGLQDQFLTENVAGLVKTFSTLIDKWFFVRFQDEQGDHLRLRFLPHEGQRSTLLVGLDRELFLFRANPGLLRSVVTAQYEPEIERYDGLATLRSLESVFMLDSVMAIEALHGGMEPISGAVVSGCIAFKELFPENFARLCERKIPYRTTPVDRDILRDVSRKDQPALREVFLAESAKRVKKVGPVSERCFDSLLHMHANRFGIIPSEEHRLLRMIQTAYAAQVKGRMCIS